MKKKIAKKSAYISHSEGNDGYDHGERNTSHIRRRRHIKRGKSTLGNKRITAATRLTGGRDGYDDDKKTEWMRTIDDGMAKCLSAINDITKAVSTVDIKTTDKDTSAIQQKPSTETIPTSNEVSPHARNTPQPQSPPDPQSPPEPQSQPEPQSPPVPQSHVQGSSPAQLHDLSTPDDNLQSQQKLQPQREQLATPDNIIKASASRHTNVSIDPALLKIVEYASY